MSQLGSTRGRQPARPARRDVAGRAGRKRVHGRRQGAFGYCHSYETSSRYDGPGVRVVLFMSGCLLRCTYCHNPDTWHLKDGTYVSAQQVLDRLGAFAPALRSARRRPHHLGRRADGAARLHPADLRRRQADGPAHRHRDVGLSRRPRRRRLSVDALDLVLLDIKSSRSGHLSQGRPAATSRRRCASPSGWPRWASRSGCASRWCPA